VVYCQVEGLPSVCTRSKNKGVVDPVLLEKLVKLFALVRYVEIKQDQGQLIALEERERMRLMYGIRTSFM